VRPPIPQDSLLPYRSRRAPDGGHQGRNCLPGLPGRKTRHVGLTRSKIYKNLGGYSHGPTQHQPTGPHVFVFYRARLKRGGTCCSLGSSSSSFSRCDGSPRPGSRRLCVPGEARRAGASLLLPKTIRLVGRNGTRARTGLRRVHETKRNRDLWIRATSGIATRNHMPRQSGHEGSVVCARVSAWASDMRVRASRRPIDGRRSVTTRWWRR